MNEQDKNQIIEINEEENDNEDKVKEQKGEEIKLNNKDNELLDEDLKIAIEESLKQFEFDKLKG